MQVRQRLARRAVLVVAVVRATGGQVGQEPPVPQRRGMLAGRRPRVRATGGRQAAVERALLVPTRFLVTVVMAVTVCQTQ